MQDRCAELFASLPRVPELGQCGVERYCVSREFRPFRRPLSGRLPGPRRGPAPRLDDEAGRPLPPRVPPGPGEGLVHGALPHAGARGRGLAPALPPVPSRRRHLLLRHPGSHRRDGSAGGLRGRRAGASRAGSLGRGRGEASPLRSFARDPLHREDPFDSRPGGWRQGGRARVRRRALDPGFVPRRGRGLEVLRRHQADDGQRAGDAPPPAGPSLRRRRRRPLLPDRVGRESGPALRHLGRRALRARLPGVGASGRDPRDRAPAAGRRAGHPVRQRLRAPARGDGGIRRRRPVGGLARLSLRGEAPVGQARSPGEPRSRRPAGPAREGRRSAPGR